MLKQLRIQNLAVVEDVRLEFGPGLNVITGSTGAGKSLILGAVNLLLGKKASQGAMASKLNSALVTKVERITMETLMKLLLIRIVARSRLGISSK